MEEEEKKVEDQEFKAFKEEENSARVYERLLFSYCVCDKRINSCVGTSFFEKKNSPVLVVSSCPQKCGAGGVSFSHW